MQRTPVPSQPPASPDAGNSSQGGKPQNDDLLALSPIEDVPGLPRVLLIGDSISIGYTVPVREALQGVANVHRPPVNCRSTAFGLAEIEGWLAGGPWQLIHFNWGLHDLLRHAGDVFGVPPDEYERNLRSLVVRLRTTGAELIWATTTPAPEGNGGRHDADVLHYNAIAARIMQEHDVRTNDLYSFALSLLPKIQRPANVHFLPGGSQVLGEQVALVLKEVLARGQILS